MSFSVYTGGHMAAGQANSIASPDCYRDENERFVPVLMENTN